MDVLNGCSQWMFSKNVPNGNFAAPVQVSRSIQSTDPLIRAWVSINHVPPFNNSASIGKNT